MVAMTRAALLSIGDELLLGEIVDTNQPHIAQRLLTLGISVAGAETVGDEVGDIVQAFQRALARAPLVIATGGLGPTADDLTLEALAKVLDVELDFYPEVMEQMAARFINRPASEIPAGNRKQAFLPRGTKVLRNDWGTAPGVHCVTPQGQHIFLLPGVPREMKNLLDERVFPLLQKLFKSEEALLIRYLHSFGIGESVLGDRIKALMQQGCNPDVGTRVKAGVVTVRITARGKTEAKAGKLLEPVREEVLRAMGDSFFGEDSETLPGAALRALLEAKKTVAIAESCTAGLIAALFTETPGSSAALLEGAVVYSNEAKVRACNVRPETLQAHGAVSAQVAAELAAGIRARSGADIGLAVTGIAGPDGGTPTKPVGLVLIGVATVKGVQTFERKFINRERAVVREWAAMHALDLLRRAAMADNLNPH